MSFYRHQHIINCLYSVAEKIPTYSGNGWQLIEHMNWQWLAVPDENRIVIFDFTHLDFKPVALSDLEWDIVKQAIYEHYKRIEGEIS